MEISVLIVIIILSLVACAQRVSGEALRLDKLRMTSPQTNQADLA